MDVISPHMLYNNFRSPSYTGRAGTMVMRTASREFPRRRADNVHDRTAHRSSRLLSPLINLLILSRPAAQRMMTWSPSTREKTGWLNSTMTYLNRQLLLVTLFVFWPSNGRILPALHYTHGFRRVSSPPGLRWRGYIRNFAHYGIIVTTCHWMTMELFGRSGVHRVIYYNCSSLSPAGNSSSWLTMPPCLAAIWAGTGHWPA